MDKLSVHLPLGGRLVVAANLFLARKATPSSEAATSELVDLLDAWDGIGVVVFAGGLLDPSDEKNTRTAAFDAHPRLAAALAAFSSAPGRSVFVLPDDGTAIDVDVATGTGDHKIRIERGGDERDARRWMSAGYAGLIAGGTEAAFANLGPGFFASVGRVGETTERRPARLGLPDVEAPSRVVSWVEVEAGADLHARLWYSQVDTPGSGVVAGLLARRVERPERPVRVAVYPGDDSWPQAHGQMEHRTRVRRRGATLIALAGALDLASAVTPPFEQRLHALLDLVPLAVPQTATALVTLSGLGLLALARGVRRGQLRAFRVALVLLVGSFLLHIVKGVDLEEASAAGVVAAYLFVHRDAFQAKTRARAIRHGIQAAIGAFAVTSISIAAAIELVTAAKRQRIRVGQAVLATFERMIGRHSVKLPDRLDDFASPMLIAVALGFVFWIAWQAIQPAAARRGTRDELRRARAIVARHGAGTLDYFALRTDKEFFFAHDSVVAFAVHQGVCLVSPDPIGPGWERSAVWDAFRQFADEQGWSVAVFGADEDWLPIYRRSGMHDLYVGDEAVVDVTRFSLEGGRHKGLRQAANRVAKYGYTMTFHDPATADDELRAGVEAVMGLSRRGDVERGFSMTLGRIFDREDRGLLLAVCRNAEGVPVAFCQYVPAPGIDGYSLDLMRRDAGEHPNGLLDFVVVETVRYLAAHGHRRLGLNFATMRAVLAGESGAGITTRVERWALKRMSGSMQIESLWRFNAKFDPEWVPRYAVYDTVGNIVPVAFAIARAESFWELPLIGRFLVPPTPTERADVDA
ncbi:MAG: lysyl-tRNA synthetase, class [Actinomycetota bacterium]